MQEAVFVYLYVLQPTSSLSSYLSACREAWKRLHSQNELYVIFTYLFELPFSPCLLYQQQVTPADWGCSLFRMSQSKRSLESKQHQPELTKIRYGRGIWPAEMFFLCVKMRFQKFHQLVVRCFWSLIVNRGITVGSHTWKRMLSFSLQRRNEQNVYILTAVLCHTVSQTDLVEPKVYQKELWHSGSSNSEKKTFVPH